MMLVDQVSSLSKGALHTPLSVSPHFTWWPFALSLSIVLVPQLSSQPLEHSVDPLFS